MPELPEVEALATLHGRRALRQALDAEVSRLRMELVAGHAQAGTREFASSLLVERLAAALPEDRSEVDLRSYKNVRAPWNDVVEVRRRGRNLAQKLAAISLKDPGAKDGT